MTGVSLVSHLYIMHGHWCKSVHDTEESNQECHELDHQHPFGAGFVPHAHVLSWNVITEGEEWKW